MNYSEKFELLLLKADCHFEDDKYASAYQLYLKCLAIEPNNIKALNNIGFILCEINADENALFFLKRAFKIDSTDEYVLLNLGSALIRIRKYSAAISVLHRIKNKNYLVFNNLGWAYYKTNKYSQALKFYNLSIEQERNNPDAYTNRGALKLEWLNDIEGAIQDFEKGHQQGDILAKLKLMQLRDNRYHFLISN